MTDERIEPQSEQPVGAAIAAPSGTVTLLFTDIEGSTQLLRRLGEGYAGVLADHHRLLRQAFTAHRGYEAGSEGDAFFVAFARASDAVAATVAAQQALALHPWPAGAAVRVRMGLHTGQPLLMNGNYLGLDVHHAARIAASAHGGQVLLSQATAELVRDTLPDTLALQALGAHAFKDFEQPEPIFQLVIAGLPSQFPALRSARAPAGERDAAGSGEAANLVGRGKEQELLEAKLAQALAGQGGLVLLAGEAGIGKTRLVEALAEAASRRGVQVLWGRCWESDGAPPFWPWVEILRGVVSSRPPLVLRAELGSGAAFVAGLVAEVREQLPDLPPTPLLEASEARFRLFDAVTTVLVNVARSQPLLLALDDLHWADKPSLLLLQFLLQRLGTSRLLVLGTYRDTELDSGVPLGEVLPALRRERAFEGLTLKGLTPAAVGDLVSAFLDRPASPEGEALAQALWRRTEGNPLFVQEELRYLIENDRLRVAADSRDAASTVDLGLPAGVRDVISRRLGRLSETTTGLLTVAAVIGREFDAATLERASGLDEAALDAALDEAEARYIVEAMPRAPGRYRFGHALFREVLYAELPSRRRMRLHGQVGEALERLYGTQAEAHVAELAYHYGEAAALVGPAKAARFSLVAGEQAFRSHAYEDALAHFQRGLAVKERRPVDSESAALLAGLGRTQMALLQLADAIASLTAAFEYYREAGETELAVEVAQVSLPPRFGSLVGARSLLEGALRLVPSDSPAAGRLLVPYATALYFEDVDDPAAQQALESALAIARREQDRALELQAQDSAAWVDFYEMRYEASLERSIKVLDASKESDSLTGQVSGATCAGAAAAFVGDHARAREFGDAARTAAEILRDRSWLVWAHALAVMTASFLVGDWASARELGNRALTYNPTDGRLLGPTATALFQAGEAELARSYVERLVVATRSMGTRGLLSYGAPLAFLSGLESHIAGSGEHRANGREAAAAILAGSAPKLYAYWARLGLGLQAVDAGDAAGAAEQYPHLLSTPKVAAPIVSDRVLGLVAATVGRSEDASAHFEDALAFCRERGLRPEYAWSCHDLAELLAGRHQRGDRERARALLDEALAIARELGMRPLLERVLARSQEGRI